MSKYIESQCEKCGKVGAVSTSDFKKNGKEIPKGWETRDCGEWGEDIFDLCETCTERYKKIELIAFRTWLGK